MRLYLSKSTTNVDPLWIEFANPSGILKKYSLGSADFLATTVADSNWHHYAITMLSKSSGVQTRFY